MTLEIPYNFKPRDYQAEILSEASNKNKVLCWHRGSGKSHVAVAKMLSKIAEKGLYIYIAPSYEQAIDIIQNRFKELLPPPETKIKGKYLYRMNEGEITFANGSKILIRGAQNQDRLLGLANIRGVIYDEAARIQDLERLHQQIISPKTVAGAFQWFISTPNGKQGYFYQLAHDPSWYVSKLTVDDTGQYPGDWEEKKKTTRPDFFQQEYYVSFIESADSYFKNVDRIVDTNLRLEPGRPDGKYHIGVDLASRQDWTVCISIDKNNNHLVGYKRLQGEWPLIRAEVESFIREYGMSMAYIDATGVGLPPVQDLMDKGLPIEPFFFSNTSKLDVMSKLDVAIQQKYFKTPLIEQLVNELKDFRYKITDSKNMKLQGKDTDDVVCALALAVKDLAERPIDRKEVLDERTWMAYNLLNKKL